MGEVIDFPLKRDSTWSELENGLRRRLEELRAPEELINDLCSWIKQTYDRMTPPPTFKFTVSLSSPELAEEQITREFEKIEEFYKNLIWSVFKDMVVAEIKLYKRLTNS